LWCEDITNELSFVVDDEVNLQKEENKIIKRIQNPGKKPSHRNIVDELDNIDAQQSMDDLVFKLCLSDVPFLLSPGLTFDPVLR
jgi:hypothetical protein